MVKGPEVQGGHGGRGVRLSIRYKLLLVISALLLLAVGAYVYLATTLFNRDKIAYVFDANASHVETVAEQTRSNLTVLGQVLALFARDAVAAGADETARAAAAAETFQVEPDLVRVEVYRRGGTGAFERVTAQANAAVLEPLALTPRDLDTQRKSHPLPLDAIAARPRELLVRNSSLPPDAALLTVALAVVAGGEPVVVAAEFRHERLLRIFGSSRLHDTYLLDEHGTVLAHADAARVISHADLGEHVLVKASLEGNVDRAVREYQTADGVAMLGAFGRVEAGRLMVLTQMTRDEALSAGRELVRRSLYFAAAVVLFTLFASIFLSRLVTSPIRKLRAATEVVAQGRFDFTVDERRQDEIGDLARSFVHMARALRHAQAQLVRSEKLAAFGELGAGITHELKNPLTGIVGFAQIAQRKLDQQEKLRELLKLIEQEGLRCKDILVNFLKFARQQSGHDTQRVDVNELVRSSAKIVLHQLSLHDVKLELELAPFLPQVVVNGGELQQVLLNLALNAQQAMPQGGRVRFITREAAGGGVEIAVQDNGPGIPAALRERIFEPFFTTKAPGEGTGLGLAISFGILRDHGGTLTVESEEGQGATFLLRLPAAPPAEATPPAEGTERKVSNG
ncbi:MAG TPA: ATP-binding protein [Myxococcus sp.]|nr:ATP-binding protein [Myxococcus sp.]